MFKRLEDRLQLILDRIKDIEVICEKAGGTMSALEEELLFLPAISTHLARCAEQMGKIMNEGYPEWNLIFNHEDIKGLKGTRNVIAHDYESLDLEILEVIIENNLPDIRERIESYLDREIKKEDISGALKRKTNTHDMEL